MLNKMCKDCKCLNNGCNGTECQVWTGCIYYQRDPEKHFALQKEKALEEYKRARNNYLNNPDKTNWIRFCDTKRICMLLGVRI